MARHHISIKHDDCDLWVQISGSLAIANVVLRHWSDVVCQGTAFNMNAVAEARDCLSHYEYVFKTLGHDVTTQDFEVFQ
jgi:hypothetical protein